MKRLCTSNALAPEKCLQTRSSLGGSTLSRIPSLLLIMATFLTFGALSPVSAQELSLVVSPPRIDVEGKPGEIIQKTIKVTNNSSTQTLELGAKTIDYIVQDDQGTPIKVTESASGRFLASPWFTLDNTKYTLAPKETVSIIVLINIPEDALPGGHYAGVFFEPVLSKNLSDTVSYTATQVGSLFGITVEGDIRFDALIKDFSTSTNVFEFGPIEFSATIENQSDTHIRPSSTISITDMFGRKLTDFPLDQLNIFPFASRTLTGVWDTVWGFGRYSANLTVSYGPGLVASRHLTFWIMPYKLLAALGVIILVIIVLYVSIRRHLKHLNDHRDTEIDSLKRKIAEMENKLN